MIKIKMQYVTNKAPWKPTLKKYWEYTSGNVHCCHMLVLEAIFLLIGYEWLIVVIKFVKRLLLLVSFGQLYGYLWSFCVLIQLCKVSVFWFTLFERMHCFPGMTWQENNTSVWVTSSEVCLKWIAFLWGYNIKPRPWNFWDLQSDHVLKI